MSDASPFAAAGPYEEQRELFEVLSQETRHRIVQAVLGHPDHLPSLDELAYFVRKSKSAILDGLAVLAEHDVVAKYEHEPSEGARDLPANFYGPTEHGVEVLAAYDYLGMVPVLRSVYDATEKTEKVVRHQEAPRPDLPRAVERALAFDEPAVAREDEEFQSATDGVDDDVLRDRVERAPEFAVHGRVLPVSESPALTDSDRTLADLFDADDDGSDRE